MRLRGGRGWGRVEGVMGAFVLTWWLGFLTYLLLTAGSGCVLWLWSGEELACAVLVGLAAAALGSRSLGSAIGRKAANPWRWLQGVAYACGPFFLEMAKANFEVAWRVITGRIRPGVVRVNAGMGGDDAKIAALANSITLTPGTLTVEAPRGRDVLYVHMLEVPDELAGKEQVEAREVFGHFDCPAWIRRFM